MKHKNAGKTFYYNDKKIVNGKIESIAIRVNETTIKTIFDNLNRANYKLQISTAYKFFSDKYEPDKNCYVIINFSEDNSKNPHALQIGNYWVFSGALSEPQNSCLEYIQVFSQLLIIPFNKKDFKTADLYVKNILGFSLFQGDKQIEYTL